jgi:hypothetical protein
LTEAAQEAVHDDHRQRLEQAQEEEALAVAFVELIGGLVQLGSLKAAEVKEAERKEEDEEGVEVAAQAAQARALVIELERVVFG